MKTVLDPEIEKRVPLKDIVEKVTPVLEQAIGDPSSRVTATWNLELDEKGRGLLVLQLSDSFGKTSGHFAPDELQPPEKAERRFFRLWGDHLQEAARRKIQDLEAWLVGDEVS